MALLALLALVGCGGGSPTKTGTTGSTGPTGPYQWTVLVYLDADNDLEAYGLMNMLQMEAVGSTNNVAILVEFARPKTGTNPSNEGYPTTLLASDAVVNGAWGGTGSDARRYLVTKNPSSSPTAMSSKLLADLGPTDMGLPQTLNNFIAWGEKYAPAQHYLLDLWDHGSGWDPYYDATRVQKGRAICFDDTFNDQIRDTELPAALTATSPLDIVATDACLMAMGEVAYEIRGQASYLLASEDETPAAGLPYTDIMAKVTSQPSISPAAFAQYMAQDATTYWNTAAGGSDSQSCCSTIDLSKMSAVATAMAPFTARLLAVSAQYTTQLNNACNNCQRFGPDVGDLFADLTDYANRVNSTIADAQLQTAAQNLTAAISSAVIATDTNTQDPNAHGMSIYFPTASLYNGKNAYYGNPLPFYPLLTINSISNWNQWLAAQPTQ